MCAGALALLTLSMSTSVFAKNIVGDTLVVRALDKVTATTKDYSIAVGETLKYGSLTVIVHHCEKKPPEEVPEVYAFLQIKSANQSGDSAAQNVSLEEDGDTTPSEWLFSGWMFASSPALSSFEHPVYDIWVLDCLSGKGVTTDENR
jgi:hypothetical protein